MRFSLAQLARQSGNRSRRTVTFRDIRPPATLATDLYRAGYAPVVAHAERTAARLADEYARTLSALTTDEPADLGAALDNAESELSRLVLLLRPALREWCIRIERWQRGRWIGAALSASGVDLSTMLGPDDMRETLEATVERNVSLVKDVGAQARQRMASAVFEGLRNRIPARDVAAQLREATAMSRRRSVAIASDQLSKITSSLADERRRQAGIDTWEWRHSRKLRPREVHKARDGKVYADTATGADPKRGVLPPPEDRPGQLPWCGCRALARIDFDDD